MNLFNLEIFPFEFNWSVDDLPRIPIVQMVGRITPSVQKSTVAARLNTSIESFFISSLDEKKLLDREATKLFWVCTIWNLGRKLNEKLHFQEIHKSGCWMIYLSLRYIHASTPRSQIQPAETFLSHQPEGKSIVGCSCSVMLWRINLIFKNSLLDYPFCYRDIGKVVYVVFYAPINFSWLPRHRDSLI